MNSRWAKLAENKWLLITLFALLYRQKPLYSSNQNTYFLHGLGQADIGFLAKDWLALTIDPFPLFSGLIAVVVQWGDAKWFYIGQSLLLALFAYSMLGIAMSASGALDKKGGLDQKHRYLPFLFLLMLLIDPLSLMTKGMAKQYILGDVFQPSVFGVFLLTSVWAFLRDKVYVAAFALAIAANVHPTYMLSAGVLAVTYMGILVFQKREFRRALLMGLAASILVAPTLYYVGLNFSPISAGLHKEAQHILVDFRIPHHAKPSEWIGSRTIIQLIVIGAAIYLTRGSYLISIIAAPFVVGLLLTAAQWITGSYTLALLFPWRISIFLVPLASAVLVAHLLVSFLSTYERGILSHLREIQIATLVLLLVMSLKGAYNAVRLMQKPLEGQGAGVEFVKATYRDGDLVLIPPQIDSFRLAAQVPILVDFKSHPYQDQEVIEWYKRLQLAQDYYEGEREKACSALDQIIKQYGVNRVVMRRAKKTVECERLDQQFSDKTLIVYSVKST